MVADGREPGMERVYVDVPQRSKLSPLLFLVNYFDSCMYLWEKDAENVTIVSRGTGFGPVREQIELAYSEAKIWFVPFP